MSSPSRCVTVNCGSAPKSRLTTICVRLSSNSPESDHSKRISDSVRMPILQCSPCRIDASRIFGRALRTYLTNGPSVAFAALFTASFTALSASVPTSDIITPYVSAIIARPAKDPRATFLTPFNVLFFTRMYVQSSKAPIRINAPMFAPSTAYAKPIARTQSKPLTSVVWRILARIAVAVRIKFGTVSQIVPGYAMPQCAPDSFAILVICAASTAA